MGKNKIKLVLNTVKLVPKSVEPFRNSSQYFMIRFGQFGISMCIDLLNNRCVNRVFCRWRSRANVKLNNKKAVSNNYQNQKVLKWVHTQKA